MSRSSTLWFGGDYNPEQWDESVWLEDVELMTQAGVTLVSVGIFSWAHLEPSRGKFDFAWLDRVIDLLWSAGVQVDLATPTAAPPPWLAAYDPATLPRNIQGQSLRVGSRQQFCPTSAGYREAATKIVQALAEQYAQHPALAMWHVHNEYMGHVSECFCSSCDAAFRAWLIGRYSDLPSLNEAWGTAFWGQRYGAWDEISAPGLVPSMPHSGLQVALNNPSQVLDWRRFCSDAYLQCFLGEREILHRANPKLPITTNHMGFWKYTDYWKWSQHVDLVANDSYPQPDDPDAPVSTAMSHDLMQSLAGTRQWMLMESAASAFSMLPANRLKAPGQMRLMSLQAVARGADGVLFFQWRTSKAGIEKHHVGMLPHAGTGTYVWDEVCELGQDLLRLAPLKQSRPPEPEVALLLDWDSWWALEGDFKRSNQLAQVELLLVFYRPFFDANIPVAFVHPDADLDNFKLVVAPNLYLMSAATAEHLARYVDEGGTLLLTCASAVVDETGQVHRGGPLAPLSHVLGLSVEESDGLPAPEQALVRLSSGSGDTMHGERWVDLVRQNEAEVLATVEHRFYSGRPVVLRNRHGQGWAYYVGTQPNRSLARWLTEHACDAAGVTPSFPWAAGLEVTRRRGDGGEFLFLLNHQHTAADITLDAEYEDVFAEQPVSGAVSVPAGSALVLRPLASSPATPVLH